MFKHKTLVKSNHKIIVPMQIIKEKKEMQQNLNEERTSNNFLEKETFFLEEEISKSFRRDSADKMK